MSDNIEQDTVIHGTGNIVVGKGDVIINPLPPAETRLRHDLGILLKNVETTWINGVLEKSVHEAALLELGMEIREEAVDNPWHMVMERPDQTRESVPSGRKIKDIFDEANRLLLILGEPGSGKTTTLLQLARELIAEVDPSFTRPVPVILNLSTWTNKQQPLDEWMIAELNSKYRLPKKDGKHWLGDRRILPLLDGLDEVKAENRAACVEKINQLVRDYGLQGLVVCSRIKEYTTLNKRLEFYRAIYLQPLTVEQIDNYFDRAGDKLANLRAAFRRDKALQSLARSPLILNIMSLTYQDTSDKILSDPGIDTDEARRRQLFDTYIARMFKRKGDRLPFEAEQTRERLSWLARKMQLHNQEVFLIEDLQPSWLHNRMWRLVYTGASRLWSGLIVGLSVGLIVGLEVGLSEGMSEGIFFGLILGLIFGLIFRLSEGLIFGLIVWLSVGIFDFLRFEWLDAWRDRKGVSDFWWLVINIASVGLIFGLIGGLIFGLIGGLIGWLIVGPIVGLIFGIRGSRRKLMNDIQTVEVLRWYWRKALKGGLIFGLIGGLIFGLLFGLDDPLDDPLIYFFSGLLGFGLIFGLIGAVFYGLTPEIIETKNTPNQGIRLSARNVAFGGLITGLIVGLSEGLIFGLLFGLSKGLYFGLYFGLIFGLVGALWYGGFDIIQHYTLRLILIIQGHTPRNYAYFLDHAVDLIFLQKVGGGYRFIHRLLLEHFAEMGEAGKA